MSSRGVGEKEMDILDVVTIWTLNIISMWLYTEFDNRVFEWRRTHREYFRNGTENRTNKKGRGFIIDFNKDCTKSNGNDYNVETSDEREVFTNDRQDDIFENSIGTTEGSEVYVAMNVLVLDDYDHD